MSGMEAQKQVEIFFSYFELREGNGLSGKGSWKQVENVFIFWEWVVWDGMGAQEPVAGRRNGRRRLSVNLGPATRAVQCPQKVS